MRAGGIGRLGHETVVPQQRLIPRRVGLRVTVVVYRQRHPVRAVTCRHAAQVPQRVLQTLAQAGEALRKAQGHVLPVRVGQDEVIQQVRERQAREGDAEMVQVREVRGSQAARLMHLAEVDFLGRSVLRLPLPHPPLQRPPVLLPIRPWVLPLQPVQQRLRLQARLALQEFCQARPDPGQRIGPRPPGVRLPDFTRKLPQIPILPCRFAIHACLHRCVLERCSLVKVPPDFLDLRIAHRTPGSHGQLLSLVKLPG